MTSAVDLDELGEAARAVQPHAHAPYSNFKVGAAVRSASGRIYVGCNVENASYGATVCAERNAIGAMVAAGETELAAVAVFTEADTATMPCGLCRQVLREFAEDAPILALTPSARKQTTLAELLPEAFVFRR